MQQYKTCLRCQKEFFKSKSCSKKDWIITKYCSHRCASDAWIGHKPPKTAFKKGHLPWNTGKNIAVNDALIKWRKNGGGLGEKHPNWKGEKAKYSAIHMWIKTHKQRTYKCSDCGKSGNAYQIHWSNIDHQYSRNLDDYIERCVPCHKKYDLENGLCNH